MLMEKSYHYRIARGKLRENAVRLHHERYQEVGFFRNNEEDPYESSSLYFAVSPEKSDEVVGVSRLIFNRLEELPTVKNFRIYDIEKAKIDQLDRSRYAELSAFTKMPQHDVGLGLIKAIFHYSEANGITHWICCVDERVYNYMNRVFKFPFRVIGEAKVYLGSTTIPCVLNLQEILDSIAVKRPSLFEYFVTPQHQFLEVTTL
jgi:N-acyl-L-homoserine lactone synthetase